MYDGSRHPRVVILGTGMIGAVHHRAARLAGAEVVGVLGGSPQSTAEAARRWETSPLTVGGPAADATSTGAASTGALADALRQVQPDVVHVCTPNGVHPAHVEAALAAGAHVICEKPLATDLATAEHLEQLAQQAGKVATVPFVYRFHPLVRELRARAQAGDFGRWQLLHGSYLQDWLVDPQATSWRVSSSAGGPSRTFADIGSHWCDLVEFVSGERIATVTAQLTTTVAQRPDPAASAPSFSAHGAGGESASLVEVDTEDAGAVLFTTTSGVLGSVVVSQVSAGRKNRLWFELDGERQSAVFDQEAPETVWLGQQDCETVLRRNPAVGAADARRLSSLPPGHPQGYAQCFESFVADTYAAVAGEQPEGLPTFADGVRSARVVDAVLRSAASRRAEDV